VLKVATYNIHKGVRGVGPAKRLEIHNLAAGMRALRADLIFLQEVRHFHHGEARVFGHSTRGWPQQPQAHFLAPQGYHVAYRTNATTAQGEHGNALLSRWPLLSIGHHDISDHRFEQRGLLHAQLDWQGCRLHAIVVHLGLLHASRVRQVQRIATFLHAHIPRSEHVVLAGDFNDWGQRLDGPMAQMGLQRAVCPQGLPQRTFPSRLPLLALDRIYTRGFATQRCAIPRGAAWARMSDHLPLLAEMVRV
jgi:endonuclease/exonuclease/phosphatase family metal-dependent hydrolase